jgi:ribosome-associated protein
MALHAQQKAELCAQVVYQAKAENIVVLDLRGISQITDFFVIASGDNPRMLKAAARKLADELRLHDEHPLGSEGLEAGQWVLLDFNDVIVHLFDEKVREYYDLELLWGDALRITWQRPRPAQARSDE